MNRPIAARTFEKWVFVLMDDKSIWSIPLDILVLKMNSYYPADDPIFQYPLVHNEGMMVQWNQEIAITSYHIEQLGSQINCTDDVAEDFFINRLDNGNFIFDTDLLMLTSTF